MRERIPRESPGALFTFFLADSIAGLLSFPGRGEQKLRVPPLAMTCRLVGKRQSIG